jgi:hypothetical protein
MPYQGMSPDINMDVMMQNYPIHPKNTLTSPKRDRVSKTMITKQALESR